MDLSAAELKEPVDEKLIDDDRTFFCSELVAKAYKVCGIMQENISEACSNFLPIDLSSASNRLKLKPEASLGSEQQI